MFQDYKDVLLVILGWLFGTLSPGIGRAILRRKRRDELLRGLTFECNELRFTAANVLWTSRRELCEIDQATLLLVRSIFASYEGIEDRKLVEALRELFKSDDAALIQLSNGERNRKQDSSGLPIGSWPVAYSLPLLASHIAELDLLSHEQQERFLRVDSELKLFNGQVQDVRAWLDRTFTATGPNHQIVQSNLLIARRSFALRCELLIRSLNRVLLTTRFSTGAPESA